MSNDKTGIQITAGFQYLQRVFTECQRLVYKLDQNRGDHWQVAYGNRITKSVSADLQQPNRWILEAIFRIYENIENPSIRKGINISFWGDGNLIDQPILSAGLIVYDDKHINEMDHWDLWNLWYRWMSAEGAAQLRIDGTIYHFDANQQKNISKIKSAHLFSIPLVSITDDESLTEKVIQPLDSLSEDLLTSETQSVAEADTSTEENLNGNH